MTFLLVLLNLFNRFIELCDWNANIYGCLMCLNKQLMNHQMDMLTTKHISPLIKLSKMSIVLFIFIAPSAYRVFRFHTNFHFHFNIIISIFTAECIQFKTYIELSLLSGYFFCISLPSSAGIPFHLFIWSQMYILQ